jgi:ribosome-associated protein
MIRITPTLSLDETELEERFIRASGPGGQNVNKVATAVQLRFDVAASPSLTPAVKQRLAGIAGRRMTEDGVLTLTAQRFRTQSRNRADALERLLDLLRAAAQPPRARRATRPTRGSKERRLEEKKRRGQDKRARSTRYGAD